MKVAVIGSGVSGLAAASTLYKHGIKDIVVFEREAYIGGHACTKITNEDGGEPVPVDCGFMVFNNVTYPNMLSWFEEHDVQLEPSDMSLGISVKNGWLEWGSNGLEALYAQKSNLVNPQFFQMLKDL